MKDKGDIVLIKSVINEFEKHLNIRSSLSERSIKGYKRIISSLFSRADLFKINTSWIEDNIVISKDLLPNTKRAYVHALRHFFIWLQWEGVKNDNPAKGVKPPARRRGKAKDLMPDVIRQVFHSLQDNRERVIVAMLYYCGLRADELLSLKLSDIDIKHNFIWVQNGKGGKERFIPYVMDKGITDLICRYIQEYDIDDWFVTTRRREKMSYMTLRDMIDDIGSRINFHFTAHQLRHSIATHLYNGDMDLLALRDFLGHTDVQTTQQYVRVYVTSVQRKYNKAQLVKNIY
jgi:integrase/recombinase XerD